MKPPCERDCPRRTAECHAKCAPYLAYEEAKQAEYRENGAERDRNAYTAVTECSEIEKNGVAEMNLKPEELVKALRRCNMHETNGCQGCAVRIYLACENIMRREAADQIERDQKEIEALREELENLKKPLDVEIFDEEGREYIDYVCPKCKETITQARKDARTVILAVRKYHEDCGQPLRWPMAGTKYGTRYRGMPKPPKEDV